MRGAGPVAVLGLVALGAAPVAAQTRLKVACQQNLTTERILVTDGRLIPDNARYKVVAYEPRTSDGVWSRGPCTIVLRGGGAR